MLNSERVVKADARGELTVLRDHDTIKLSINNYLKPGDFLETIINQRTLCPYACGPSHTLARSKRL